VGRSTFENKATNRIQVSSTEGLEQLMTLNHNADNSRIVVLHGDVNEHTIATVISQLLQLANVSRKPIHLVVSTYGGSVDEMFSLYDTIKFLPCPVHTIALGKVMSAGVLLLAAGEKGKRLIGRSARIMMHPVSGGMYGNVFEVLHESKEHRRLHDLMVQALCRETKMKPADIQKIMKAGHDYYITADEAIKLGVVDRMVGDMDVKLSKV
jgi:ATP-dependent Clp protease protease subunit